MDFCPSGSFMTTGIYSLEGKLLRYFPKIPSGTIYRQNPKQ